MRRTRALLLASALLAIALAPAAPPAAGAGENALEPASTGGLATLDRALARLSTHKRVLVIGAHPDDEDTSLLTLVSRGMGGEAAYLSLSRGEGGQNLIGSELGEALGLLRTQELLAARRVDGGRQFFTRAYDFGFTRSLDETLRFWPHDALLEDAVRVIRRFMPQVVVSVFPASERAGHGQHQAAGLIAPEAFRAAGDPAALPELAAEGLAPWRPQVLYRETWFDPTATTLELPLGGIDPLAGRSYFQLAMASRSQHRSQDMGRFQDLGPKAARLAWLDGDEADRPAAAGDLFAGVDTGFAAIAAPLPAGETRSRVATRLAKAQELAEGARRALRPAALGDAVAPVTQALGLLLEARQLLTAGASRPPAAAQVVALIDEKVEAAGEALAVAKGIAVDATAEVETVAAGDTLKVEAVLWNSGGEALPVDAVELVAAPGLAPTVRPAEGEPTVGTARKLGPAEIGRWAFSVALPADSPPTEPYFLRRPRQGDLYDWSAAPPRVEGEPFGPPPLTVRFTFAAGGVPVVIEREVVYRYDDQASGERRRPLRVVPALEVAVDPDLEIWPTADRAPRPLAVTLTSHARGPLGGRIEVTPPAGWPAPAPRPFHLEAGGHETLELALAPPRAIAAGRSEVAVVAVLDGGGRFDLALPLVDYPHVRPTPRPVPARVTVAAADLALPRLGRVGYVRGASDRVPEVLRQVGVPIELLSPHDLGEGDLGRYDAIVVGSRAYETDPALVAANGRLLDYARRGGLVIVQYQQYPYVEGKLAPYPLDIARPHDRVTDETAPVRLLDPASPVFTTPNRIGPQDWEGWVQERGLYFAHTWDPAYTPLLAMADPGGPELSGSLLVARVGEGTYVYTGLAFFRQLPAGVPGAYRLFANLLALARPPAAGKG